MLDVLFERWRLLSATLETNLVKRQAVHRRAESLNPECPASRTTASWADSCNEKSQSGKNPPARTIFSFGHAPPGEFSVALSRDVAFFHGGSFPSRMSRSGYEWNRVPGPQIVVCWDIFPHGGAHRPFGNFLENSL